MTLGLDAARLDLGRLSAAAAWSAPNAGTAARTVAAAADASSSASVGPGQCRACAERKYQDVSNDPTVSFQTPTSIAPGQAAAAVAAHEQEHVAHNAARAEREGMTARSTVTLHTDVCPECGRVFVAGGTTRTMYTKKAAATLEDDSRGLLVDATA